MAGILDKLNIKQSRVTRTLDNFVCTIIGKNGVGKTPVACQFPNVLYFAVGKSGLTGINNVNFISIKNWSEFKKNINILTNPKDYDELHQQIETIVLDEAEVLYDYCTKYVCGTEGVNKIKEGNGGYGLWQDLKTEWEETILKLIGSGFAIIIILHASPDSNGKMYPTGDDKRFLPILLNHSDIIGYVRPNGLDADGKPIHSSLILTDCNECFARTRNPFLGQMFPVIEDFTAENLINAYYKSIDAQAAAEGVKPITRQEQNELYTTEDEGIPFDELMLKTSQMCSEAAQKYNRDKVTDIIERTLGVGKQLSSCTEKQKEAVQNIYNELKLLINE